MRSFGTDRGHQRLIEANGPGDSAATPLDMWSLACPFSTAMLFQALSNQSSAFSPTHQKGPEKGLIEDRGVVG